MIGCSFGAEQGFLSVTIRICMFRGVGKLSLDSRFSTEALLSASETPSPSKLIGGVKQHRALPTLLDAQRSTIVAVFTQLDLFGNQQLGICLKT